MLKKEGILVEKPSMVLLDGLQIGSAVDCKVHVAIILKFIVALKYPAELQIKIIGKLFY